MGLSGYQALGLTLQQETKARAMGISVATIKEKKALGMSIEDILTEKIQDNVNENLSEQINIKEEEQKRLEETKRLKEKLEDAAITTQLAQAAAQGPVGGVDIPLPAIDAPRVGVPNLSSSTLGSDFTNNTNSTATPETASGNKKILLFGGIGLGVVILLVVGFLVLKK
jgi:hypothetical protein